MPPLPTALGSHIVPRMSVSLNLSRDNRHIFTISFDNFICFHSITGGYNRLSWDGESPAQLTDSALDTQMAHDYIEKGVAVIDNFLAPEALTELLRCMRDDAH